MNLGIDLGATHLRVVRVEPHRIEPLGRWKTPDTPRALDGLLQELARVAGGRGSTIGLAAAPALDEEGKVRQWPNRPAYEGFPLAARVRQHLGAMPAWLDDCAAAALAEHAAATRTRRQQGTTTLYVGAGTGIGAGAVVADRLHVGARGAAFGLGHLPIAGSTALCPCGRRGCLQLVASGRALEAAAAGQALPMDRIAYLAGRGHPRARRLMAPLLAPLAEGIALAARLLDPHRIVLGGGLTEAGGYLVRWVARTLRGAGLPQPVRAAAYGDLTGAVGAALWAARPGLEARLYRPPPLTQQLPGIQEAS